MEISLTENGHQEQGHFPFSVISMAGTEKSSIARRTGQDSFQSLSPTKMESLEYNTIANTRFRLKDPMDRRKTEIQHGLSMQSKILNLTCMIQFSGTPQKSLCGLMRDQLPANIQMRVLVSMKLTLAWPKSLKESALTEILLITTLKEL